MVETIFKTSAWLFMALGVVCWVIGAVSQLKAVRNRRKGVGLMTAGNWPSLLFRDRNYTDDGVWWARIYRRAVAGFFLCFLAAVLPGWIAYWLGWIEIDPNHF
jgi:hypothetical protein